MKKDTEPSTVFHHLIKRDEDLLDDPKKNLNYQIFSFESSFRFNERLKTCTRILDSIRLANVLVNTVEL